MSRMLLATLAASVVIGSARQVRADVYLWDGGSGTGTTWMTATNWSPDAIPGGADQAVFSATNANGGTIGINFALSPGGTQEIGQIVLTSGVSRILENISTNVNGTLRLNGLGGNILSNGSGSAFLRIRAGTAGTSMGLQITGDSEIYTAGGNIVLSNAPIQEVGGTWRLTKSGPGALRLSTSNNYSGGTLVTAGGNSSSVGAFILDHMGALGSGDVIYSNTASTTLMVFGPGSGAATFSNNIVFSAAWGAITNRISSGNATNSETTLAGLISGGSATAPMIIDNEATTTPTAGRGRLRFVNPANSFRVARFIVNNGGLVFTSDGALGDTNNTIAMNGNGAVAPDTGLIFGADDIVLSPARMITIANPSRIDVQSFTGTVSGVVSNKSTINKWGAGRLIFDAPMVSIGATNSAYVNEAGVSVFNASNSAFGTMTVNAGSVLLGPSAAFSGMTVLTVASNALFDSSAVGAFTLSGSNRAVQGFGTITGDVVLASRARLSPGGVGTPGTLAFLNNLVQDGSATNAFDVGGAASDTNAHDLVNVGGGLFASGDLVVISLIGALEATGSYRLINCSPASIPNLTLAPTITRYSLALDTATPGQVNLQVGGQNGRLLWTGTGGSAWDVGLSTNWLNLAGATNDIFMQSDDVVFDDSVGVPTNVTLAGLVAPASITVTSSLNQFTFAAGAGRLRGSATLRKYGTSSLSIASTNTEYAGTIEVRDGTLRPGLAAALGSVAGPTLITDTGSLEINGLNLGAEPLYLRDAGFGGAGTLVNNGAVQTNAVQAITLLSNATVGGAVRWDLRGGTSPFLDLAGFTLTKTGTNIVGIAGRVTNAGDLVVGQGTVSLEPGAVLSGPGGFVVQQGAMLNFQGSVSNLRSVTVHGGLVGVALGGAGSTNFGPVVLQSNGTLVASGNPMYFAGPISGPAGFSTLGPNSLGLVASNSFSGDVLVPTGILRLGHSGALGACTSLVVQSQSGGTGLTGTRVELFGTISLGSGVTLSLPSTLTGDFRSTFYCAVGTNDWNGTLLLNGDGNINLVGETTGSVLNINGPINGPAFTGTAFLRGNTGNGTVSGRVTLPLATVSKVDGGTWYLSSTGNVWANTAVRVGALRLLAPQALAPAAPVTMGQGGTETAILDLGGFTQRIGRLLLNSTGGTKVIGNGGTNAATLVIAGNATSSYAAVIADSVLGGTNVTGLVVENAANVTLNGANTFSGPTLVSNAWLRYQTAGTLARTPITVVESGVFEVDSSGGNRTLSNNLSGAGLLLKSSANNFVTRGSNTFSGTIRATAGYLVFDHIDADNGVPSLDLSGGNLALPEMFNTNDCTVGSLSGTAASVIDPNYNSGTQTTGPRVLAVYQSSNATFAGAIKIGSGGRDISLRKQGNAVLTLSGTNTYGGPTFVSNGTLLVQGSLATGLITVAAAGTLGGTGLLGGSVVCEGVLAPGASAGKLLILGSYTQAPGGTLAIEIGGATAGTTHDWLDVSGSATIDGALSVTLIDGYVPTTNDLFLVLSAGGVFSGAFATTNLPALGGGNGWKVDYLGSAVMLSITNGGVPPVTGYDLAATVITNGLTGYQDDADGDGYVNLLEYVTGGSLTNAGVEAKMQGTRTNGLLALRFNRDTNAVDATIIVEGSGSAANSATWLGIATNIGGSWGAATNVFSAGTNSPLSETVYDTDSGTNRFLRLRVTRP